MEIQIQKLKKLGWKKRSEGFRSYNKELLRLFLLKRYLKARGIA